MSFEAARAYGRQILQPLGLFSGSAPKRRNASVSSPLPPALAREWEASTHTFVGASNRVTPSSWPTSRFEEDANAIPDDVKFNKAYDAATASDSNDAQFWLYERAESKPASTLMPAPPLLVVKRYAPKKRPSGNGITLLWLSGLGQPKETFEPFLELLLPQLATANVAVDEVWTVDMPMCGDTAQANAPSYLYGNEKDICRDLLHFVTAYLPVRAGEELDDEALPYRAPKPDGHQATRANLHVVAHSMGAQSSILMAAHAPLLFSSLSLFDPAVIPPGKVLDAFAKLPKEMLCTMLPERSASRDALKAAIKANKRTCGWDDRIVDAFLQHAVVQEQDGTIKLKSPPRLEWALYYDQETPAHAFDRIQDIRTPVHFILPARPFATPPKVYTALLDALPQRKRVTWMDKTTHQIVYERLEEGVKCVATWLVDETQAAQSAAAAATKSHL